MSESYAKILKLNSLILLIALSAISGVAQTPRVIERNLVKLIEKVQNLSVYAENTDYEKLEEANSKFKETLLRQAKTAVTLKYGFPRLRKKMIVATSPDGRLRVYSWDTESGGTMHFFDNIYQYRAADNRVYSYAFPERSEGDAGSFVYDVFETATESGKIYLLCSTAILSTQDSYGTISLMKINGTRLDKNVKLIRTAAGLTAAIGFEYNFFSVVDRPERPIRLIKYDPRTEIFKIPLIVNNKKFPNGEVTNNFISYRFNGKYFLKTD